MKTFYRCLLSFLFVVSFIPMSYAAVTKESLAGLWHTYDDHGASRSIVKFYTVGHEWQAKIVKVNANDKNGSKFCTSCQGNNRNKPLVGMTIIWGLNKKNNQWVNGKVLNTDNGKTYNCSITLSKNNKILHFYAYIAMFGKTIDWKRVG